MIADNATLAGDITMGNDCSIWFGAVLRADVDKIVMGDRCNVQDLACIHQTAGGAAVLGKSAWDTEQSSMLPQSTTARSSA